MAEIGREIDMGIVNLRVKLRLGLERLAENGKIESQIGGWDSCRIEIRYDWILDTQTQTNVAIYTQLNDNMTIKYFNFNNWPKLSNYDARNYLSSGSRFKNYFCYK